MNPWEWSMASVHERLRKREISAVEVLDSVFSRIHETEPRLHAFLALLEDSARQQARDADVRFKQKRNINFLTGVPMGLKDNLCVKDFPTTCASKILENFRPPYNATVVERLNDAGAVFVGKTNMDEFAMGSSTEHSAFGITRNPWNLETVPGGSSGGSAASVAAGQVFAALGSDTGGSIRQPASLCGVVGLKPTYGLVSRYGLIAFASSLDQIGPLTRSVVDSAKILECIGGRDPRDSTCANINVTDLPGHEWMEEFPDGVFKKMVCGIPSEFFGKGLDPEVKETVLNVGKQLERLGVRLEQVRLPSVEYGVSAYYVIASAEASSNLARYDGTRYGLRVARPLSRDMFGATRWAGFGMEVKRRIMLGTYALSAGYYDAFYLKAQKVRTLIKRDFDAAFKTCDFLLTPTSPTPAFKLGEKSDDPLSMYLADIYTIPVNLAGLPGLSIPVGISSTNLPIGAQLLGPAFHDFKLLAVGRVLEKQISLAQQCPVFIS